MSVTEIREKLHNYLEIAEDRKIEAMYALMENEIEEGAVLYTDSLKNELNGRASKLSNGESPSISAEQSQQRITEILYSSNLALR